MLQQALFLIASVSLAGATVPELVVVSGANGRYGMKELAVMLDVVERARRESIAVRLIVYNLGDMGHCEDGPSKVWSKFGIELRDFNFSKYPKHVSNLHCYAWKPPIIHEVAQEFPQSVVAWIDSGVAFHQSLRSIIRHTRENDGFISDETAKSIARFAHEKMIHFFVDRYGFNTTIADAIVAKRKIGEPRLDSMSGLPAEFTKYKNCNGAFSAHIYNSPRYQQISTTWLDCSLDRECICPQGSNRANHRQDQAVLTLLAVQHNYVCGTQGKFVSAHGINGMGIIKKFGLLPPPESESRRVELPLTTPLTRKQYTKSAVPAFSSVFCHRRNYTADRLVVGRLSSPV